MTLVTMKPGTVGWLDITVGDAEALQAFYQSVVGWVSEPVDMEGYQDHCMKPPGADAPVAGICHARGPNAALPPQWLPYFIVADLDASLAACTSGGGAALTAVRDTGQGRFVVIRDPAGAACALYQTA